MKPPKILACASASLPHTHRTEEIVPYIRHWLSERPELLQKTLKIFDSADIRTRCSVSPLPDIFTERSFEETNNEYAEYAVELGAQALERALDRARLTPTEIDCLITVSCTGYMIPSLDAYLINRYRMRRDIHRLPVLQMGCAGGTSGLIYATDFLQSHPGARAAVIAVEIPTLTFQHRDFSMANIVSTAIFADGAACVILGDEARSAPAIVAKEMYHFPEATRLMGYSLRNTGLQIVLDRAVPEVIDAHLDPILRPFLERNGISFADIGRFVFHPGSVRILERAEALLERHGRGLEDSKHVLRTRGNMSSATVFHILERVLEGSTSRDEFLLLLAFGPGFVGQTLLCRWC